jgi:hypothetical protein
MAGRILPQSAILRKNNNAGPGTIAGVVDRLGAPGPYRVFLHYRPTGQVLKKTVSAPDGAYVFADLPVIAGGYYAVAFDSHEAEPLNAAIADRLTPTV